MDRAKKWLNANDALLRSKNAAELAKRRARAEKFVRDVSPELVADAIAGSRASAGDLTKAIEQGTLTENENFVATLCEEDETWEIVVTPSNWCEVVARRTVELPVAWNGQEYRLPAAVSLRWSRCRWRSGYALTVEVGKQRTPDMHPSLVVGDDLPDETAQEVAQVVARATQELNELVETRVAWATGAVKDALKASPVKASLDRADEAMRYLHKLVEAGAEFLRPLADELGEKLAAQHTAHEEARRAEERAREERIARMNEEQERKEAARAAIREALREIAEEFHALHSEWVVAMTEWVVAQQRARGIGDEHKSCEIFYAGPHGTGNAKVIQSAIRPVQSRDGTYSVAVIRYDGDGNPYVSAMSLYAPLSHEWHTCEGATRVDASLPGALTWRAPASLIEAPCPTWRVNGNIFSKIVDAPDWSEAPQPPRWNTFVENALAARGIDVGDDEAGDTRIRFSYWLEIDDLEYVDVPF